MRTLVLDTTLTGLTLGLSDGAHILAEFTTPEPRSGAILHPHLQDMLAAHNAKLMDMEQVIITIGPGSFTGIRLGLAFAQALQVANPHLKITAVSTLQSAATQFAGPGHLTVWLDAAGGQVYTQTFGPDATPLAEPAVLPQADAEAALTPGTTLVAAESLLTDAEVAHTLTTLGAAAILKTAQNPHNLRRPEAFYLKPLTYKTQA